VPRRGQVYLRVLVAFEDDYRTYQGVIASALRVLRPQAEVQTATLDALGEAVERFDPELVICSGPNTVDPGGRMAWVELSVDPTQPSKICVGGRYSESTNPTLEALLEVIDEVEELIQANNHIRGC
jgi:F420-dependent methylenetetrahydromethanopterin dehydrogenase